MSKLIKRIYDFFIKIKGRICVSKNKKKNIEEKNKNIVRKEIKKEKLQTTIIIVLATIAITLVAILTAAIYSIFFSKKLSSELLNALITLFYLSPLLLVPPIFYIIKQSDKENRQILETLMSENCSSLLQVEKELHEKYNKTKLKLQKQRIYAKLKLKPLKHSFLISLLTTIIGGLGFLGCVWLYWRFQCVFVIKPEFYGIQNDFCKLALIVLSKAPIIVFFIVGLMFCKRFFTWWDKYRDYLSLWEYHSRINDKDKQDALLIALAPNYFGTKRNRKSDNNFMEKLLLKMIPTLNINAGGGSNNGNNGGQNGGQNP